MGGRNVVIKVEDCQKYLQTHGYRQSDLDQVLQRAGKIPSDQLNANRRVRLLNMKPHWITKKAALVSIITSIINNIRCHPFLRDLEIFVTVTIFEYI